MRQSATKSIFSGRAGGRESFRTLGGVSAGAGNGITALDSSDTTRFYALYAVCDGEPGFRQFAAEYLRNRFDDYSDVFQRYVIDQPARFLQQLIADMLAEWNTSPQSVNSAAAPQAAAILAMGGGVCAARAGAMPMYLYQSRRMRPIFDLQRRSKHAVEVTDFQIGDGDRVILMGGETAGHLTKLEMKNILASEDDVAMITNKLSMLAVRHEGAGESRIAVVEFVRGAGAGKGLGSKKMMLAVPALLLLLLTLFLWGDLKRFVEGGKNPFMFMGGRRGAEEERAQLDAAGRRVFQVTEVFSDLAVPYDAAPASEDELYVIDDREQGIVYYNISEQSMGRVRIKPGLTFPTAIEVFRDILYVVDFSSAPGANSVLLYTRAGDFLRRIPENRSLNLRNPKAIALSDDGSLYLCDRGNNRILKFNPEGELLKTIRIPQNMDGPNGIALAPGGDLFITLKTTGIVARITDESSVKPFTILDKDKPMTLSRPAGLAIDRRSNIYIADTGNRRVLAADQMGRLTGIIDSTVLGDLVSFYPMSVKLSPDGKYLYIVGSNQFSYEPGSTVTKGKIWRARL